MPLLSDLTELKTLLEIHPLNTQEDKKLFFLMGLASDWIMELLNRPGLFYKSRTEIYNGNGTMKLPLRSRPVYKDPLPRVWFDTAANFGATSGAFGSSTELVYGSDFCLQTDSDDDTKSRCGLLIRLGDGWYKPFYRQKGYLTPLQGSDTGSIRVTYTGGYTVDDLPTPLRGGCNFLVARMRYVWPLGVELNSDSYEERNIGVVTSEKEKLLTLVKPMIWTYRNWSM